MQPDKQKFYKRATSKLLQQLNTMKLSPSERLLARKTTMLLRNSFQMPDVKNAVFDIDWSVFKYDSDGFCLAASCAFIQMMDSPDWQLMYIGEIWSFGPHHFLKHIPSNTVFDLTYDQYANYGLDIPYDIGTPIRKNAQHRDKSARLMRAIADKISQNATGGF